MGIIGLFVLIVIPFILFVLFQYLYIKYGLNFARKKIKNKLIRRLALTIYFISGGIFIYSEYIWDTRSEVEKERSERKRTAHVPFSSTITPGNFELWSKKYRNINLQGTIDPVISVTAISFYSSNEVRCISSGVHWVLNSFASGQFNSDIPTGLYDKQDRCNYELNNIIIYLYKKNTEEQGYFSLTSLTSNKAIEKLAISCANKAEHEFQKSKKNIHSFCKTTHDTSSPIVDLRKTERIDFSISAQSDLIGISEFNRKEKWWSRFSFYNGFSKFMIFGMPSFSPISRSINPVKVDNKLIDAAKNNFNQLIKLKIKSYTRLDRHLFKKLNAKNSDGYSAFYHLVNNGNNEMFMYAIDRGAGVGRDNAKALLRLAIIKQNNEIRDYLIQNFSDDWLFISSIFDTAIIENDYDTMQQILAQGFELNDQRYARSVLIKPIRGNDLEAVEYLIKYGANVNFEDKYGNTPIHSANTEFSKLLIAHGANINKQNHQQETPLIKAAKSRNTNKIKLLINNGANKDIADKYGKKAIDYMDGNNVEQFIN